jgi:hypothetical protein
MTTLFGILFAAVVLLLGLYIHALRKTIASLKEAGKKAVEEERAFHEKYWDRLRGIPVAGTRFKLEGVGDIIVIGHNFEKGFIEFCLSEDFDTRDPDKDFTDVIVMSNDIDNFTARAEHALALM